VKCAERREQDDEPCEAAYAYTALLDLSTIMSKNWTLFQSVVPKTYAANRKQLETDLVRLNRIRNAVMHPVKERKWTEDDFEFVRRLAGQFKGSRVQQVFSTSSPRGLPVHLDSRPPHGLGSYRLLGQ
jgi:hypothetical protein